MPFPTHNNHYSPRLLWALREIKAIAATWFGLSVRSNHSGKSDVPFLFLVGCGRSGNTLLRRLMMERLSIYIPPETYVLPKIADYRTRARGLAWPSVVDLVISAFEYHPEFIPTDTNNFRTFAIQAKQWETPNKNLCHLLEQFYLSLARTSGCPCTWIGDKSPVNTLFLNPINKILPSANYIYILRDGADVAKSYLTAGLYPTIEDAGRRWAASHKSWVAFKRKIPLERYVEIRFDTLVSDPESVIAKVQKYFDIPERPSLLDVKDFLGDVSQYPHHSNAILEPTTATIGTGRKILTAAEKARLRPVIESTLISLGYPPL